MNELIGELKTKRYHSWQK